MKSSRSRAAPEGALRARPKIRRRPPLRRRPPDGSRPGAHRPDGRSLPRRPPGGVARLLAGCHRPLLRHWATGWIVAALLVGAVVGLSLALANSSPTASTARIPARLGAPGGAAPGFGGRFGAGGAATSGTVDSVSSSSFTMTTSSGSVVTVDEQSSTTYHVRFGSSGSTAVAKGDRVLVEGTTNGSTIEANVVIILPSSAGGFGSPPAS